MGRILALCSRVERAPEVVEKARELSGRLEAGVTFLYVKEEGLFELPIYAGREENMEAVRGHLERLLHEKGLEDWALLVYENDLVDHAVLEADREDSVLIVTDRDGEPERLMHESGRPLYLLVPGANHHPGKALYVPDVVGDPLPCFRLAKRLEPGVSWEAYMDYQFFPSADDAMIDPVVGAMTPEILLEQESEIIGSTRKRFLDFCEAQGIRGRFEIGEHGIKQELSEALERTSADLLVVAPTDPETILAEGVQELLPNLGVDLLICFQKRMESQKL